MLVSSSKSNSKSIPLNEQFKEVAIDEIKIGERRRKSLGNLDPLEKSIQRWGFSIHDVVINEDGFLVAGRRRLEVFKRLGFKTIRVKVVPIRTEDIKLAEYEENVLREDFTVSELVADFDDIAAIRIRHRVANGKVSKLDTFQLENKGKSTADIMKEMTGKSRGYLYEAKELVHLVENNPGILALKPILDKVDAGEQELHDGLKKAKYTLFDLRQKAKDEVNLRNWEALPNKDKPSVYLGDFTDFEFLKNCIKTESVDLFITDPLYAIKFLYLYKYLPRTINYSVPSGASAFIYLPDNLPVALNYVLPDEYGMANHAMNLHYVGIVTVELQGPFTKDHQAGITRTKKDLLWVVKGDKKKNYRFQSDDTGNENDDYIKRTILRNLIKSETPDKRFHYMSQSPKDTQPLIKLLCPINGLIFDPMTGGGMTAIAAKNGKCRFIGIDKDPKAIEATYYNLAQAQEMLTEQEQMQERSE
jgi:DNA methylase/ParB-like nuclease domain